MTQRSEQRLFVHGSQIDQAGSHRQEEEEEEEELERDRALKHISFKCTDYRTWYQYIVMEVGTEHVFVARRAKP